MYERLSIDPALKKKLMRRDREQRLRHLAYIGLIEVIKVLRGEDHRRFLLAHALEAVADVLYRCRITQPDVQLVERGDGVALGKKLIGHITENIEEHRVLNISACHQEALYSKHEETRRGYICVSIEELRVRTFAY